MIATVDAGPFLTATVYNEIRHALKKVHHGAPRLIRLPVDEFNGMAGRIIERGYQWTPFQPMLCGLPVDQGTRTLPEIVVVCDDDTNISVNVLTETEVS
jgi:hypothetical protein